MVSADRVSAHYDDAYFARQIEIGQFGAWANRSKFWDHIRPTDTVLDFGCGSGLLLKGLDCARRLGVEINPAAVAFAERNGVEVFSRVEDVPDNSVDVVISNHALEHALRPLDELKALHGKLREGGRIVIVVPCDSFRYAYKAGDVNRHLYSWSPMNLGNLLDEAGFEVLESSAYVHKWPPKWRLFRGVFMRNRALFDFVCRISGVLRSQWTQVRAVGLKRGDRAASA